MAKRDLEASVNAERDACIILRGELQESKEALGKLRHEVGTLDAELKHQVWLCQGREEEVLRLPKLNVDLSAQLREAQKHCEDLVAAAQLPIPDIHNDDSKARLWEVTDTTQKMWVALGSTIGTLWYNELELRRNLDSVLALLQMAPGQMTNWLFSAAFEGAHQVLAGVRAHHPAMDLRPLVRVVPGDQNLEAFFEEVSEDAEFAAGAYEPQTIVKRAPKDVDGSS